MTCPKMLGGLEEELDLELDAPRNMLNPLISLYFHITALGSEVSFLWSDPVLCLH